MREREGLIARIRQLRRAAATTDKPATPKAATDKAATDNAATDTARPPTGDPDRAELEALQRRINDLEQLVQGLQDSVHRESERLSKRLTELEARTQPAALGAALSKDARERGL